ncbi:long-chain-fatty-acid--CoA ligase [Mycolicibacterium madagascariense]|uniref:Long-chain-fatty-acid--CoA ligase n=1 Tax=Mycolicibacterium madagascariense TaxID=212765 RepID=A0A7I7XBQ3_9MYCO|nr:AMP-binding protein [Mycolicibacterium madagascariense]MCV7014179.1 AMP-binding protein [Mycolicibacterium madagascariense]BBZ25788.1 long-chain-fatty-acid--CoA ligase [Mycolicibacterium madagascariense]
MTRFDYAQLRDAWYRQGWFSESTCVDAFATGALENGTEPVTFVVDGETFDPTIAAVHQAALALAASLQELGVGQGDAVAAQLTNRPECAIVYQAVLLCGAVLVPIPHVYGIAEVRFILTEAEAAVLFMPDRWRSTPFRERVPGIADIATLRHVVLIDAEPGPGFSTWSELDRSADEYVAPSVQADDVCLLMYTSGTTSAPKGVQHSHNSLLAEHRTMPALLAGGPDDVLLVTFPPGHIAGVGSILRPLLSGNHTVFMDGWDAARAVEVVRRFRVTATAGTPFHLAGLLDLGDTAGGLATLRQFLIGAAPVTEELGRRAAAAGISTFRSYGSTEHPTVTGLHTGCDRSARLSTDGEPLPGSRVRILGPDGAECQCGDDGEVVVQGPEQFVGYRDHALDADAFTADGWFRTGDLGHVDAAGRLSIIDRIKDVIIRAGETISSGQVEDVLNAHPGVAEAAAVAAPHSHYGEVVAAVVVMKPSMTVDLPGIQAHFAASGLARQKTPERLVVVDAMPRTALGKVRKAELRARYFAKP